MTDAAGGPAPAGWAGGDDAWALARVASLPGPEQVAEIRRLLGRPSREVRDAALRVGAVVLPPDQLVAFLREPADDTLRNAGVEMLKARGRDAVPVVVELLSDRDADVVLQAVLVLDALRDLRALEPLRATLRHGNLNVVQAAILAVGHLGSRALVGELVTFLGHEPWVQMAAIEALGDLRAPDAIPHLARSLDDAFLGPLAADAMARIGGVEAFRQLAAAWLAASAPAGDLERLACVTEGLLEPPPSVEGLVSALRAAVATGGAGRGAAARCLLAVGPSDADGAALDTLLETWHERHALPSCLRRRHDLTEALLGRRNGARGWGLRLAATHAEQVPSGALAAALSSCRLDDMDAVAEVLLAVEHDHLGAELVDFFARLPEGTRTAWGPLLRRHRAAIRRALDAGGAGSAQIREVLAIVVDEDGERAARALVRAPGDVRLEALRYLTDRPEVLERLPWVTWLEEAPEEYGSYAVAVAEQAGLRARLPALRAVAARHPHRDVLRLLGRLRDAASLDLLEAVARAGRPDLRPFALGALGAIGGDGARRALADIARGNPATARFAYRALAECHVDADVGAFREVVDHGDWHVRMVAAEVLGGGGDPADLAALARLAADPVPAVADRARAHLAVR